MNCEAISNGTPNNEILAKEVPMNEIYDNLYHPLYYGHDTSLTDEPEQDCFRLLLIEQGTGIMWVDGFSVNFTAPSLICLNEKDFPIFEECKDVEFKSIYFKPDLINSVFNYINIRESEPGFAPLEQQDNYLLIPFLHRDNLFRGLFSIDESTQSRVLKLIHFIGRELEHTDLYWPCRSRSYLLEILILATKLLDSTRNLQEHNMNDIPQNIEKVISYIHNNYKEKITLDQLAVMFNTNRTSLNNQFYKATNLSIIDYIIKLRVKVAATLLRNTLIPISEVMIRVGFNDSSHFWRTFKKNMSLTPKEYREKYCWIKD